MTSNYYTLLALAAELRPALVGRRFVAAYSYRPNELRIVLEGAGTLVALLRPISGGLFLSRSPESRPKSNVRSFFPQLDGRSISGITVATTDRSVAIEFGDLILRLDYFGTPNALLVREGVTLVSFKREGEVREKHSERTGYPMLGKKYLAELASYSDDASALDRALRSAEGAIVYRSASEILLSLIPLRGQVASQSEHYDSVNDAIRATIIERAQIERMSGLKRQILSNLTSELERLERSQAEMRKGAENSNRAERYLAIANAILMIAHEIPAAAGRWTVLVEQRQVEIALDANRNAYENATAYFERAKRAKDAKAELAERATETREAIAKLRARIAEVKQEVDAERLTRYLRAEKDSAKGGGPNGSVFREFTVAGGMRVLVGKNAKQNDELTLHVAKKEDVWLHARGVPGSHVVLVTGNRSSAIPREAIEQAAEIAAYYSDARTQGVAPVAYTAKKYVRKPRGAAPGAVKLEREEVIMVTPKLRGRDH